MTDKFIILNNDQVQGILYRNQTQHRIRVTTRGGNGNVGTDKQGHYFLFKDKKWHPAEEYAPYQTNDVLWVKEGFLFLSVSPEDKLGVHTYYYRADIPDIRPPRFKGTKWKPSVHMKREAARLFLRITNVRAQQLRDMTPDDVKASGYEATTDDPCAEWGHNVWDASFDDIDKKYCGWDANPLVWVFDFERITEFKKVGKYLLIP